MKIEIKFLSNGIQHRVWRTANDSVRYWEHICKGAIVPKYKMCYDELRELGEGLHEVRPRTMDEIAAFHQAARTRRY